MHEIFPDKKPGDILSANHVNRLNKVARIVASQNPGSFGFGQGGHSIGLPPMVQRCVTVVQEEFELGKAGGLDDVYEIRYRYFDNLDKPEDTSDESSGSGPSDNEPDTNAISGRWKTDDTGSPFYMDASSVEQRFNTGDKLIAFWEQQRGMWLPCGFGIGLIIAKSLDEIPKGGLGDCQVYDGSKPSDLLKVTDKILEGYARLGKVKADKWVYLIKHKGWYEVVNAEC